MISVFTYINKSLDDVHRRGSTLIGSQRTSATVRRPNEDSGALRRERCEGWDRRAGHAEARAVAAERGWHRQGLVAGVEHGDRLGPGLDEGDRRAVLCGGRAGNRNRVEVVQWQNAACAGRGFFDPLGGGFRRRIRDRGLECLTRRVVGYRDLPCAGASTLLVERDGDRITRRNG